MLKSFKKDLSKVHNCDTRYPIGECDAHLYGVLNHIVSTTPMLSICAASAVVGVGRPTTYLNFLPQLQMG